MAKTPTISKVILKDHLKIDLYEYTRSALAGAGRDPLATPDIRANAPEDRTNQETDILSVR